MRFPCSKCLFPTALAALVGIAGLAPVPIGGAFLPVAEAQGTGDRGPATRSITIGGRGYSAQATLHVLIGGAPTPTGLPNARMTCTLNLYTLDGHATGALPPRISMWVRGNGQARLVTLTRVQPNPELGIPVRNGSAIYTGDTTPIDQSGPIVVANPTLNVQIQWREGRRIRFAGFGQVPVITIPLP